MNQPSLGSKIAALRIQKGITQKELADLCKVDIRTIQRIEAGEVVPRMHTLKLLSNVLGYDLNEFPISKQPELSNKIFKKQICLSLIAGSIYWVNYTFFIYNSITQSFPIIITLLITGINIVTCIIFQKGFYLLAQQYKNQLLVATTLMAMILLPVMALLDSSKYYGYGLQFGMTFSVLAVVCLNGIMSGVGMFIQGQKLSEGLKANVYKYAAVIGIFHCLLVLSGYPLIMIIGTYISIFSVALAVIIMYLEYKSSANYLKIETDYILA